MTRFLAGLLSGKNSFKAASLVLIVTLFISNILGMLRDHFLSQKIPTDVLSVYYAAFRIPDLIFNILILGAISAAFIPVFSGLVAKEKMEEAWKVANSVINIAIICLIVSCLLLWLLMGALVPLFVPGFDVEKQNQTVLLARVMLASPLFFGLSYIFGGILNSFKRFVVYSLAPLVYNLSIILGTLLLADRIGIIGVALAVVFGAFLHMAIQIPIVFKLGWRWHSLFNFSDPHVRRIGKLMLPRALGLGANQILLLIFTGIASSLAGSAVAVYNLADNIQTMPMVVFGTSFAMAIFPVLSEQAAQKKYPEFGNNLVKTLRSIMFFIVPIVFGLILLRAQIVRLILGSGFFGWEQTIDTANALGYFAAGLLFTSIIPLFARAFYALQNTKTPMVVTIITVTVSIGAGFFLSKSFGVLGLAMAYSIGSFINAVVLYLILRTKIAIPEKEIFWFFAKILIAALIMAVALQEIKFAAAIFVNMQRFWGVLTQTFLAIFGASLIYLLLCWIFNCEEIASIKIIFAKLTGRSLVAVEEPGR